MYLQTETRFFTADDAADMATAASVTIELTTCSICLEELDNPRSLPCLHTFCLKCLQGYFKDNHPGDEIGCPMCRKVFQIPSAGLTGFPHNFIIQSLIDDKQVSSEEVHGDPCVVCLEESDGSSERKAGDQMEQELIQLQAHPGTGSMSAIDLSLCDPSLDLYLTWSVTLSYLAAIITRF